MFKSPKTTGQLNYNAGLRKGHFNANISCGGGGGEMRVHSETIGWTFVEETFVFQNVITSAPNDELEFLVSSKVHFQSGFDFSPQFYRSGGFPRVTRKTSLLLNSKEPETALS